MALVNPAGLGSWIGKRLPVRVWAPKTGLSTLGLGYWADKRTPVRVWVEAAAGNQTISPTSIGSAASVGTPTLVYTQTISPPSIASAQSVGSPTVTRVGSILDTFTAADNTSVIGRARDDGGTWIKLNTNPDPKIVNNRMIFDASGNTSSNQALLDDVGSPNVRVAARLAVPSGQAAVSVRVACSATNTGGMRFCVNRTAQAFEMYNGAGSLIASIAAFPQITDDEVEIDLIHYRGHMRVTIGGQTLHGWLYDYTLGGPDNSYDALIPTGTYVSIDSTGSNNGICDVFQADPLDDSEVWTIYVIGDSMSVFSRSNPSWPREVGERVNDGLTQVRAYNGGGEGVVQTGSSGNNGQDQANNIVASGLIGTTGRDVVLIQLGTNDGGSGTLQDEMEAMLDTLTGAGIAARNIHVLEIFPVDATLQGVGYYDRAPTRANWVAACLSRGVPYHATATWWDPATQSIWSSGTNTLDGLHPGRVAHALIGEDSAAIMEPVGASPVAVFRPLIAASLPGLV